MKLIDETSGSNELQVRAREGAAKFVISMYKNDVAAGIYVELSPEEAQFLGEELLDFAKRFVNRNNRWVADS